MHLITVHEFSTYTHLMRLPALLAFAVWSFTAWAEILEGRVVSIADGDTLTLLDGNRQQHKLRAPHLYPDSVIPRLTPVASADTFA